MPAFYIAPEASIPYEFVSPTGARAVLNDPTDPDFCGYLDGEEAISGIDSPEIRDSFAELAGADGALAGVNFYSRRPIVMNGRVIPSSAADRNQKLGKLMAATDARFADGTLSWTPSGGEPVFLKFRRQLPFRTKGGFNKEFQIGLVANDPRIYSRRSYHVFTETNGNSAAKDFRRFTYASSGTTVATRTFYIPPGEWRVVVPVRCSLARTVTLNLSSSTGTATPAAVPAGVWTEIAQTKVTSNAEGTATTLTVTINSALTSANYLDIGDVRLESPAGLVISPTAGLPGNWVSNAAFTMTFQSTTPSSGEVYNPGNALAFARGRFVGPLTVGWPIVVEDSQGLAFALFSYIWAAGGADLYIADSGFKTIVKNGANAYGLLEPGNIYWGGIKPGRSDSRISANTGATTATRTEIAYRGVWI